MRGQRLADGRVCQGLQAGRRRLLGLARRMPRRINAPRWISSGNIDKPATPDGPASTRNVRSTETSCR